MSYEDFLIRYDGRHAEWVDGEVIVTLPISDRHDAVSTFLTMVLGFFVQSRGLGRVLTAPFQMKLGPTGPGREPDVMFVARERLDRVLRTRLAGPADVAIEIISPDSIERDRHDKYAEYEAAGVPESGRATPSPSRVRAVSRWGQ